MSAQRLLVMIGTDGQGRAQAARFMPEQYETAAKVSKAAGLQLIEVTAADLLVLAKNLPDGMLHVDGTAPATEIDRALYDKFFAMAPKTVAAEVKSKAPSPAETAAPDPWASLSVGTIVLCMDPDPESHSGWWPCKVTAVASGSDHITIRWRDWPDLPAFAVRRAEVALVKQLPK